MNEKELTRKCMQCKKVVPINFATKGTILRYEGKWYHLDCFTQMCQDKAKRKNCSEKWSKALEDIPKLIKESNEFIDNYTIKDKIYRHIMSAYNLSKCTDYIFQKLDGIYTGTLSGLAAPIPPAHLLDMWVQKQKWLDKNAERKRDKTLVGTQRVVYDMAILCGKYNDYKNWLATEKIKNIAEAHELCVEKNTIDYSKIKKTNSYNGLDDINNLLDDIL